MTRVGDRVRLVNCTDPYTKLNPGDEGEVASIDSRGTVHVNWDSGAKLGLIAEAGDRYEVISNQEVTS